MAAAVATLAGGRVQPKVPDRVCPRRVCADERLQFDRRRMVSDLVAQPDRDAWIGRPPPPLAVAIHTAIQTVYPSVEDADDYLDDRAAGTAHPRLTAGDHAGDQHKRDRPPPSCPAVSRT